MNMCRVVGLSLTMALLFAAPLLCIRPISVQMTRGSLAHNSQARAKVETARERLAAPRMEADSDKEVRSVDSKGPSRLIASGQTRVSTP